MSSRHTCSWCRRKGVHFCNHPQWTAPKGNRIILIDADHKVMVKEGIDIVESVNCSVFSDHVPFVVVGDLDCVEVKSFWFKVEANLRLHIGGTKHEKALEDAEKNT